MGRIPFCSSSDAYSLARLVHSVERAGCIIIFLLGFFLGQTAFAETDAPEVTGFQPPRSDWKYYEAQELLKKEKWAEAAIQLKSYIAELKMGAATGASYIRDSRSAATLGLARALVHLGRREEAIKILSDLASLEKGKQRDAILRRLKVLSRLFLTNETAQIYQEGENLIFSGKYTEALTKYEKALEKEADNVGLLLRSSQCLIMENKFETAVERLKTARRLNPYESEIQLWLGRALHKKGELPESLKELKSAYNMMPTSQLAPVWLAESLVDNGKKQEAITLLEVNIKSQPLNLLSILNLVRIRAIVAGSDKSFLWKNRRDLQLAMSRFEEYSSQEPETEMGPAPMPYLKDDVKKNIATALNKVEEGISLLGGDKSE